MKEKIEKYIKDLVLLEGLSGHEQLVSKYLKDKFTSFGLECKVDPLGNTYTKIEGTEPGRTMLITAHMDSLGLIVKHITENGFLKFERVGGIPEKTLPALHVSIKTRNGTYIPGVIGVKSHHLTSAEDKYKVDKYQELYIDVGCDSAQEVEKLGIEVGCPIIYKPNFEKLNKDRITGTSFDNRLACATLVEIAERLKDNPAKPTVYLAGTVQEELTIRGAATVAYTVNPDMILCLDITMEGGTPDLQGVNSVRLGKGPAITLYNFHGRGTLNGTMAHPAAIRLCEKAAEKLNIKLQRVAMVGSVTEIAYMQVQNGGIAGIDLDIPCRYTHSQCEVADINDVLSTIDLVESAIRLFDNEFSLER